MKRLSELYKPRAKGEQMFVQLHKVEKIDAEPKGQDDVFSGGAKVSLKRKGAAPNKDATGATCESLGDAEEDEEVSEGLFKTLKSWSAKMLQAGTPTVPDTTGPTFAQSAANAPDTEKRQLDWFKKRHQTQGKIAPSQPRQKRFIEPTPEQPQPGDAAKSAIGGVADFVARHPIATGLGFSAWRTMTKPAPYVWDPFLHQMVKKESVELDEAFGATSSSGGGGAYLIVDRKSKRVISKHTDHEGAIAAVRKMNAAAHYAGKANAPPGGPGVGAPYGLMKEPHQTGIQAGSKQGLAKLKNKEQATAAKPKKPPKPKAPKPAKPAKPAKPLKPTPEQKHHDQFWSHIKDTVAHKVYQTIFLPRGIKESAYDDEPDYHVAVLLSKGGIGNKCFKRHIIDTVAPIYSGAPNETFPEGFIPRLFERDPKLNEYKDLGYQTVEYILGSSDRDHAEREMDELHAHRVRVNDTIRRKFYQKDEN